MVSWHQNNEHDMEQEQHHYSIKSDNISVSSHAAPLLVCNASCDTGILEPFTTKV